MPGVFKRHAAWPRPSIDNDATVAVHGVAVQRSHGPRPVRRFRGRNSMRAQISRATPTRMKIFTGAGGGDAADAVLRIGAGADNGCIADTAPAFRGGAAGGGAGRDVAAFIQRDDTDGAELVIVGIGELRLAARAARPPDAAGSADCCARRSCIKLLPAALSEEVGRIDLLEVLRSRRRPPRPHRPASRGASCAPSPRARADGMARAGEAGDGACGARCAPSMMEASRSLRPSAVNTAPRPALKSGSSSISRNDGLRPHRAMNRRDRGWRRRFAGRALMAARYWASTSGVRAARAR